MSIPERSNWTGKIYLGDKIICDTPCRKILTFDFQNNWELWWYWNTWSARYWYTAWQWFYQYSTWWLYWWQVSMPESSWQSWKLIQVKLRWTRPNNNSAIWFDMYGYKNMIRFWGQGTNNIETCVNDSWQNFSSSIWTWESEYTIKLNDDWSVERSALWTSRSFTRSNLGTT